MPMEAKKKTKKGKKPAAKQQISFGFQINLQQEEDTQKPVVQKAENQNVATQIISEVQEKQNIEVQIVKTAQIDEIKTLPVVQADQKEALIEIVESENKEIVEPKEETVKIQQDPQQQEKTQSKLIKIEQSQQIVEQAVQISAVTFQVSAPTKKVVKKGGKTVKPKSVKQNINIGNFVMEEIEEEKPIIKTQVEPIVAKSDLQIQQPKDLIPVTIEEQKQKEQLPEKVQESVVSIQSSNIQIKKEQNVIVQDTINNESISPYKIEENLITQKQDIKGIEQSKVQEPKQDEIMFTAEITVNTKVSTKKKPKKQTKAKPKTKTISQINVIEMQVEQITQPIDLSKNIVQSELIVQNEKQKQQELAKNDLIKQETSVNQEETFFQPIGNQDQKDFFKQQTSQVIKETQIEESKKIETSEIEQVKNIETKNEETIKVETIQQQKQEQIILEEAQIKFIPNVKKGGKTSKSNVVPKKKKVKEIAPIITEEFQIIQEEKPIQIQKHTTQSAPSQKIQIIVEPQTKLIDILPSKSIILQEKPAFQESKLSKLENSKTIDKNKSSELLSELISLIRIHNDDNLRKMRERLGMLEEDIRARTIRKNFIQKPPIQSIKSDRKCYEELLDENLLLKQQLQQIELQKLQTE